MRMIANKLMMIMTMMKFLRKKKMGPTEKDDDLQIMIESTRAHPNDSWPLVSNGSFVASAFHKSRLRTDPRHCCPRIHQHHCTGWPSTGSDCLRIGMILLGSFLLNWKETRISTVLQYNHSSPFSHTASNSSLPSTQSVTALQNEYCGRHWPLLHLKLFSSQGMPL